MINEAADTLLCNKVKCSEGRKKDRCMGTVLLIGRGAWVMMRGSASCYVAGMGLGSVFSCGP